MYEQIIFHDLKYLKDKINQYNCLILAILQLKTLKYARLIFPNTIKSNVLCKKRILFITYYTTGGRNNW